MAKIRRCTCSTYVRTSTVCVCVCVCACVLVRSMWSRTMCTRWGGDGAVTRMYAKYLCRFYNMSTVRLRALVSACVCVFFVRTTTSPTTTRSYSNIFPRTHTINMYRTHTQRAHRQWGRARPAYGNKRTAHARERPCDDRDHLR